MGHNFRKKDSNWERKAALLGWASKSSAWVEPNTNFTFVAGCPDNSYSMKVLHFLECSTVLDTCGIAVYSKTQTSSSKWLPVSTLSKASLLYVESRLYMNFSDGLISNFAVV